MKLKHILVFDMFNMQIRIRYTERVYILPIGGGGDGDEHLMEFHQVCSPYQP